ncbi:RNA polymerase II transcription factor SIII subunit A-domain-containing protein [Lipomyces japonicus]|uniref:RNA polymerase II transcription factor SIII subunit A-domain-containing protein n=1 Tax=Lipomyces japonicus TaxID=56871 RepID=UPI0034CD055C
MSETKMDLDSLSTVIDDSLNDFTADDRNDFVKYGLSTVKPLFNICLQQCIEHSQRILDIGDIPYSLIEQVLQKMGPQQLYAVEKKSPHIRTESRALWQNFILKTFSEQEIEEMGVKKGKNIREYYFALLEARQAKLHRTSAKVQAQYAKIAKEKAKKQIVTLDVYDDPQEAQRRKRKLQQMSSSTFLKKLSVVKRARIETMSNPRFSNSNIKINAGELLPISHEEADRRRQEKLNQRVMDTKARRNEKLNFKREQDPSGRNSTMNTSSSVSKSGSLIASLNSNKPELLTSHVRPGENLSKAAFRKQI